MLRPIVTDSETKLVTPFVSADFAVFTELARMSIHLTDSDVTLSIYKTRYSEASHGARDTDIVSTGALARFVDFVELRAERAVSTGSLVADAEDPKSSKRAHSVIRTRANSVFINKFTRHGNRQRSAKGFAKAASAILAFCKRLDFGSVERLIALSCNTPRFSGELLVNETLYTAALSCADAALVADSNLAKSVSGLFFDNRSVLNTELLYKNLIKITPLYSMKLTRIPKQRYKNIRNKLSHYEMRPYLIKKEGQVSYWFKYAKYSWNFSSQRTYQSKYVKLLYETVVVPGASAGYVAGKNVYIKKLYK